MTLNPPDSSSEGFFLIVVCTYSQFEKLVARNKLIRH